MAKENERKLSGEMQEGNCDVSSDGEQNPEELIENKISQMDEGFSFFGYVAECILDIIMASFHGINWLLQFFGLALKPLEGTKSPSREKRKRSEVETEDDEDDSDAIEHAMEGKRWRPDCVYEAIQEFIKKLWTEEDINDVTKDGKNGILTESVAVSDGKWNKKPDINFVKDSDVNGCDWVVTKGTSAVDNVSNKEKSKPIEGTCESSHNVEDTSEVNIGKVENKDSVEPRENNFVKNVEIAKNMENEGEVKISEVENEGNLSQNVTGELNNGKVGDGDVSVDPEENNCVKDSVLDLIVKKVTSDVGNVEDAEKSESIKNMENKGNVVMGSMDNEDQSEVNRGKAGNDDSVEPEEKIDIDMGVKKVASDVGNVEHAEKSESAENLENKGEVRIGEIGDEFVLMEPKENVETSTPLVVSDVPEVFVFSGDGDGDLSVNNNENDGVSEEEKSLLSMMTFAEKKVYFAQQIKDQETAAKRTLRGKTPPKDELPSSQMIGGAEDE